MNGGQVMVVLIVAIVMVASIVRAKYGHTRRGEAQIDSREHAENMRLREEVKELKQRIQVIERITVEKENTLSKQIEELRDR